MSKWSIDIQSYNAVVQSLIAVVALVGGGVLLVARNDLDQVIPPLMGVIFGYYFSDRTNAVPKLNTTHNVNSKGETK